MKHLKKFENFPSEYTDTDRENDNFPNNMEEIMPDDDGDCEPCEEEEEEEDYEISEYDHDLGNDDDNWNDEYMEWEEDDENENWDEENEDDFSRDQNSEFSEETEETEGSHIMKFEERNSYKKSKKKEKPDFLKKGSKNKDEKDSKEKDSKGLTAAQKKLPEGLRKAIEARKKK